MIKEIPDNPFIMQKHRINETVLWDGGPDNEKAFKKARKNLKEDWYYHNQKITYIRNEWGFRDCSVKDWVWEESIVILGCSCVEGIGVSLEDTIGKNLEKIMNTPVINLGVSGAGIDFSCMNSLLLNENLPRPKAIIQFWSGIDRYTDFWQFPYVTNYLPKHENYYAKYDWCSRNKLYVKADRALWKDKVPYVDATYFEKTANELEIDMLERIDRARDQSHPGHKTYKKTAEWFAEKLKEQGI